MSRLRLRIAGKISPVPNPVITSPSTFTIPENTVLGHTLTADVTVTWSIVGGADQGDFELNGSTLRWISGTTKDYEIPDDVDTNNTYVVQVRATHPLGVYTNQTITGTVTDVVEVAGSIVLTDQGVDTTFADVASYGQHVDGSYWVVPSHADGVNLLSVAINSAEIVDLYMGGVMIDPGRPGFTDIKKQGFDSRTSATGSGPGASYDSTYKLTLPARVKHYAEGPKTIWIYRGSNTISTGGGASGCARMVQITVYGSAPSSTTIKPPGLYCAAGKPIKTRADINYSALPSLSLPSGAVQPDWDRDFGLHKYPIYRWGDRNNAAAYVPQRTQETYSADQAGYTNQVATGCCYNITKRTELIERMVRDGMEYHAGTAFAPVNNAYAAVGGFGPAGKLPRFIAGIVLNDSAYLTQPNSINVESNGSGALLPYFAEDCSTYWSVKKTGDTVDPSGTYQALYGTDDDLLATVPGGDFLGNHTGRDTEKLRDSYRIAQFTWTVESVGVNEFTVTAASHTATKHYQPNNANNQWYNRGMRIMTGVNAGKFLYLRQKSGATDVSWTAATRTVKVEFTAADALPVVLPAVGDIVEYRPAAVYEQIVAASLAGTALAVVLMDKVAEYCNTEDQRAMFMFVKDHITNLGLLVDKKVNDNGFPYRTHQRSSNVNTRTWGPAEANALTATPPGTSGKWLAKIYPTVTWPTFTGPLS